MGSHPQHRLGLHGTLRLGSLFATLVGVAGAAMVSHPVQEHILTPFTAVIIKATSVGLNLVDLQTTANALGIEGPVGLGVGNDCNGSWAHLILTAAILSFPAATLYSKILGLIGANITLFVINAVRIASLYLCALYYPALTETMHVYVWQFLIILVAVLLFSFWALRIGSRLDARQRNAGA
jgi:exosortase/archaeosortase family protein